MNETELGTRLAEALDALRAIRQGEVDALVVSDDVPGVQVFTLSSADRPYRMFVETMRDGAATVSEQGVVLYANQRLAEMLGAPLGQIVGTELAEFVPVEHAGTLLALSSQTGSADTVEMQICTADETPMWVRVGASSLDVDGERMVCLTFADLTATRQHASDLAGAHDQAVEALRLRSLFVANMSHEIRTPLNGVIGMTGLMLDTNLDDEQREYADGIRASAAALMSVVDQILDFSKFDDGNMQLEQAPFAPLAVLEDVSAVVSAAASAKGIELLAALEGEVPSWVEGDSTRLRQVLTNLMTNAIKFTDAGHVCTTVSAVAEQGRWRLRFQVQDTGIGVSAEATSRIFESFSQADGSTTRRYGGTGLGLAISKQLVELMEGEIGVQSVENAGSCFWFTVVVGAVSAQAHPDPPLAALRGRVLVVDDNLLGGQLLERLLLSWGLTVTVAADGVEAHRLVCGADDEGAAFDLALVDSEMPGVSGIDLVRAIRARPNADDHEPLRVAMLMTSQRDRNTAREAGVDWFLSKPVRQSRLFALVAAALDGSDQGPGRAPEPGLALLGTDSSNAFATRLAESVSRRVAGAAHPTHSPTSRTTAAGRLLLVEDNEINQLVGARMLQKRGFVVDIATNGQAALEMQRATTYAGIFMDCHMPVLDGYQTTAEIRRRESDDEHVTIIAMTANTIKGDREKCLAAGMDDYLGKPFTAAALDAVIERALPAPAPANAADRGEPVALIDESTLDDLCLGDEDIRHDLVTMFVEQSKLSLTDIEAAISGGDARRLFSAAHNLKGSSASVGALRMTKLSDALCAAGRSNVVAGAVEVLEELRGVSALTWQGLVRPVTAARAPEPAAG